MGEKKNAGEKAPTPLGGVVNVLMGKHAYSETGKDSSGREVTGYGHNSKEANANYQKKGGKT